MWTWYNKSWKCFIYLYDVSEVRSKKDSTGIPIGLSEDTIGQISESDWFTRGWTLQELLAPKRKTFFDREWREFGQRKEMPSLLSQITGIEENFLNGSLSLMFASNAQKMSWASKRRTTRQEDESYCLLGLFDVNMPLLYGEGRTKAFQRLQVEIMKNVRFARDNSIFAWMEEKERFYGMFATAPSDFRRCGNIGKT